MTKFVESYLKSAKEALNIHNSKSMFFANHELCVYNNFFVGQTQRCMTFLIKELYQHGLIVWPTNFNDNAFIFEKGDPRLIIEQDQGFIFGTWYDKSQKKETPLPALDTKKEWLDLSFVN